MGFSLLTFTMSRYSYKTIERAERKRSAELARQAKAREKESALDAARRAVWVFEARVAELKSMHKQCTDQPQWLIMAGSLPPCPPVRQRTAENAARRVHAVLLPHGVPQSELPALHAAASADAAEFLREQMEFESERREQEDMSQLAKGVLEHEPAASIRALRDNPSLAELSAYARMEFTHRSQHLVECTLFAQTSAIVPARVYVLTSTGKLTSKDMPRADFMRLYQDFLCSAVLRVGREIFTVLPVSAVLVTVLAREGATEEQPIISVVLDRARLMNLHFDSVDPSDAVDTFPVRTDFKASRRTGAFGTITPFQASDVEVPFHHASIAELMTQANILLDELE